MNCPPDSPIGMLHQLDQALAHAQGEAQKWRRLALTLGIAMRPVLSGDAGPGGWQIAQRALQTLDAETAR